MRKVHQTDMVAHLWAHQTQDYARNPHGNFYFQGTTIYSYGTHFPIARHVDENTILFTTRGYSPTTSKHICCVRSAMPGGKRVFYVHNPAADWIGAHRDNHDKLLATIKDCERAFAGSRLKKAAYLKDWEHAILAANVYAKHFKLNRKPAKLKVTAAMKAAIKISNEKLAVHEAKVEAAREKKAEEYRQWAARNAEEAKRREEEKARELAEWEATKTEKWAAWLRGEVATTVLQDRHSHPVLLRAIPEGTEQRGAFLEQDILETSHGAIVPLEDARRAFVIVRMCRCKNKEWHRNGEQVPVGDFQLDSISATGNVVAGCHKIHWEEIERFAKAQGWYVE